MAIMHNRLSRLKSDSKAFKKFANKNLTSKAHYIDDKISSQWALDIIAKVFGWENWNSLFKNSQEGDTSKHSWWRDMRYVEKKSAIENGIASLECEPLVSAWMLDRLLPKLDNIGKEPSKGFFSKLKRSSTQRKSLLYQDFSLARTREGMAFLSSSESNLDVAEHISQRILPELDTPGSIVYCNPFDAIDFLRAFSKAGYKITTVGFPDGALCSDEVRSMNISNKILLPTLTTDNKDPFGLYCYLTSSLGSDCWKSHRNNSLMALIELVVASIFRESDRSYARPLLNALSLDYCVDVAKESEGELQSIAIKLLSSLAIDPEKPLKNRDIEQFQFVTMQISVSLNWLQEQYLYNQTDKWDVNNFKRPIEKEVLFFAYGIHTSEREHTRATHKMLMHAIKGTISADDSTWMWMPTTDLKRNSLTQNDDNTFDWSFYNKSELSLAYYGGECMHDELVKQSKIGTLISLKENGIAISDFLDVPSGKRRSDVDPVWYS
jgi:hypothetical protein